MLPTPAHLYLLAALDNTPATVAALLGHLPEEDTAWNIQPDPKRFQLREIVAHLEDWEAVWQERFERTVNEDIPLLTRPDINQRAIEQGYASANPVVRLKSFLEKRAALTAWLRLQPEAAWGRRAHLDRMGEIPLEGLVALALGHDSYHLNQIAEWSKALRTPAA
jgi:hypothetical protein